MAVFSFVLGLILGSFLNVCIHRIPLRQSIVNPPSHCPGCGQKIRFYDNIPLISYIVLLGKCRQCRQPIPLRYPLVELIMGLLSLSLYFKYHMHYLYFLFLIFTGALLVISFIDLQHQIIPDIISIPGILLGFLISVFFDHITWYDSLIGILGGGGALFLVAVIFEKVTGKEGMGGGDVKLLAMIGAWMGWKSLPFVVLASSFSGLILGGGSLLLARRGLRSTIPFGPFLALGALAYLFFGHEIMGWYFRLLF